MSEQQPEVGWAPIPPKPSRRGRVWLIVGLVVAALVVAAVLLLFLLPRGESPEPGKSPAPTPSTSATASAPPEPTGEPTTDPVVSPPPAADPSLDAFRGQVSGWLSDAGRGLDIVARTSGQDALTVIATLQEDAQRLSDSQAPSSILEQWREGVATYAQRLTDLRAAVSEGADAASAVDAARAAAQDLKTTVAL